MSAPIQEKTTEYFKHLVRNSQGHVLLTNHEPDCEALEYHDCTCGLATLSRSDASEPT